MSVESYPIVEAICEFRFGGNSPWDMAIPGLLFGKLEEEYPERKQIRLIQEDLRPGPTGPERRVEVIDRMQLVAPDQKSLLQVNQNLLTVNRLAPYDKWEAFKPRIEQALKVYRDIAQPTGLDRIGLRYINRLSIPGDKAVVEDYFNFYPHLQSPLPQYMVDFNCFTRLQFDDLPASLNLVLRHDRSVKNAVGVILDLDIYTDAAELDCAIDWVEGAHQRLDDTYRSAITDRTRALLEEGK
jgi:uncharacterized protein (TIGR04255 family)